MESISFQLRCGREPFVIDFDKFDINVLHSITRILDIEGFKHGLVIGVNNAIYRQIGDWVAGNHWIQIYGNHFIQHLHE